MILKDFTKEKFDIIVLAGQSNAEGTGIGRVENAYVPDPRVWFLSNHERFGDTCIIEPATESVSRNSVHNNLALTFAEEYVKNGRLEDGRSVLIIRTAVGGTGFADNRWTPTGDLYLRMLDLVDIALSLNRENRIVAFLCHQGEAEVVAGVNHATHYKNLMTLVKSVREYFDDPLLPFVAGDFVYDWKSDNEEGCAPIVRAMRDVCADCGCSAFVETDGLLSNLQDQTGWADSIHFSRRSLYELGRRYFGAYIDINK